MFWDLLAAVCAGVGAAGIALALRSITRKRFPAWTIPVFAGLGIFGYQIYRDYTWLAHQQSLLPADVKVVKTIEQSSPLRPWTYLRPHVVRFIAMRLDDAAANQLNPDLMLAEVFLFERHQPSLRVHQVFDCGRNTRADFGPSLQIPLRGEPAGEQWFTLPADDPMLRAACARPGAEPV